MPKLSIITVNLNNAKGLEETIKSVISQTFTDYEYIIIDGGSNDGSKEIIEKYSDKITYWVSEKDKGIYNGMNKGINIAKGEYCLFMNSGDIVFDKDVFKTFLSKTENIDFIYGNVEDAKHKYIYTNKITLKTFLPGTICHQAVFIKTDLFRKFGLYDERFTIIADREFFIRTIILQQCSYRYINKTVSFIEIDGFSSNPKYFSENDKQKKQLYKKYFPLIYEDYLEMDKVRKELSLYKNSRLIKLAKKIQNTKIYKTFISK